MGKYPRFGAEQVDCADGWVTVSSACLRFVQRKVQMLRQRIRQLLPATSRFVRDPNLRRILGALLDDASLWHLNRTSIAWAVSVGLFMAFVPLPCQMLLAAIAAALIGCNLPISVALVWISNPITIPPMFYAAYKLGAWVLNLQPRPFEFELSFGWVLAKLGAIWQPFLLGCFLMGFSLAVLGHVAVRLIWRIHVSYLWRERRRVRRNSALKSLESQRTEATPPRGSQDAD